MSPPTKATINSFSSHYVKMINDLDGILSLTRQLWLDGRDAQEKQTYMKKLNGLLDQRSQFMRARDAGAPAPEGAIEGIKA